MRRLAVCGLLGLTLACGSAWGHFPTFWPDSPNGYGSPGTQVVWQLFWGHPYEYIVFDTPEPRAYVVAPDGVKQQVKVEPASMKDPETGKERRTYRLLWTPQRLGDHWLVVENPPIPVEEEGLAVCDYAKQCLHVMAEVGWEKMLGLPIELVPLTRPYGLEPAFAVTFRAYMDGKPLADATVEIEKFNGFHPSRLPTDQFGVENSPLITRVARTDDRGYVVCTLDEPGWWVVAVSAESGQVEVEGRKMPRLLRGCLWLHVEEPYSAEP